MRVTVGVSGGIAAYKAAELVRALQRQAIEVHVVMTEAACKFVQPLTFAALTGHKVITSLWDDAGTGAYDSSIIEHIGEAQWADALVVAPATANILAKFAHGIADDFLTTLYLATTGAGAGGSGHEREYVGASRHASESGNPAPARRARHRAGHGRTGLRHGGRGAHGRAAPLPTPCSAPWAAATTWPAKSCWSPPEARARPSTRSASSATAPAARWATRWPKPRRAAAPKSFSSAALRRFILPRIAS
jgi:hypothetical protein